LVSDARFDHRTRPSPGGLRPQKGEADKVLGRPRGGLTTKIHLLTNEWSELWTSASPAVKTIDLLGTGPAEAVIADKGYDIDAIATSCGVDGRNGSDCVQTTLQTATRL
jgi:hypothetical protein